MAIPNVSSFSYSDVADKLRRLREAADKYTPSPSTLMKYAAPLIGGPGMYALQGAAQGDILNNHKIGGGAPQPPAAPPPAAPAPNPANWGIAGFPSAAPASSSWADSVTKAPLPQGALSAPQASPPTQSAAPPPPQAGPALAPQAPPQQAPQINPNGSIAGAAGPTSVGGAPLVAQNAPTPQPDMSFFQRNAAMMRDPMTGQFIDPTNAAQAQSQIRGPDLINKMLALLHDKAST